MQTQRIQLSAPEQLEVERLLAVQRRLSDAEGPGKAIDRDGWQRFERIARAHGIDPALVAGLRIEFRAAGVEAHVELRPEPTA